MTRKEENMTLMRYLTVALVAVLIGVPISALGQSQDKPNILVIWGDDIGITNISYNNRGLMGYRTPNIDRIAEEGLSFTD
jgi:arylsulfatase